MRNSGNEGGSWVGGKRLALEKPGRETTTGESPCALFPEPPEGTANLEVTVEKRGILSSEGKGRG